MGTLLTQWCFGSEIRSSSPGCADVTARTFCILCGSLILSLCHGKRCSGYPGLKICSMLKCIVILKCLTFFGVENETFENLRVQQMVERLAKYRGSEIVRSQASHPDRRLEILKLANPAGPDPCILRDPEMPLF